MQSTLIRRWLRSHGRRFKHVPSLPFGLHEARGGRDVPRTSFVLCVGLIRASVPTNVSGIARRIAHLRALTDQHARAGKPEPKPKPRFFLQNRTETDRKLKIQNRNNTNFAYFTPDEFELSPKSRIPASRSGQYGTD